MRCSAVIPALVAIVAIGLLAAGWLVRGDPLKECVLLLHGNGESRQQMLPVMQFLADAHFTVLAISLRAHGDSTGEINDIGWSARHDVIAAVAFLQRECPHQSIFIVGRSLGAAAAITWSHEELALRWKRAWPAFRDGQWIREPKDQEIEELLGQLEKLAWIRRNLSSLSWFMARWKEPIAKICNKEMDSSGYFWAARFGCRELLDDAAVASCSVYVETNRTTLRLADHRLCGAESRVNGKNPSGTAGFVWGNDSRARTPCSVSLRRVRIGVV